MFHLQNIAPKGLTPLHTACVKMCHKHDKIKFPAVLGNKRLGIVDVFVFESRIILNDSVLYIITFASYCIMHTGGCHYITIQYKTI